MDNNTGKSASSAFRTVVDWTVFGVTSIASIIALVFIVCAFHRHEDVYTSTLFEHLRAIVGIPLAGASAFCVLVILEVRAGQIEFEGLGFRFRGASGPAVIWVFAFLALSGAIRLLW